MGDTKTITISRSGPYGMARKLKVFVDGEKIALLKHKETIEIDVPSSSSIVYGSMDWAKTNKLSLENVSSGDHLHFKGWFTLNPFRNFGIPTMPMKVTVQ